MRKAVLVLALLLLAGTLLAGCGGSKTETTQTSGEEKRGEEGQDNGAKVFTVEDLAQFDGKDGRPAYVAVDGVVYDLAGSSTWPEGDHTPCDLDAMAGKDLSETIEKAPARMRTYLQRFPVVGKMAP